MPHLTASCHLFDIDCMSGTTLYSVDMPSSEFLYHAAGPQFRIVRMQWFEAIAINRPSRATESSAEPSQ
jgi:hypothetical protein